MISPTSAYFLKTNLCVSLDATSHPSESTNSGSTDHPKESLDVPVSASNFFDSAMRSADASLIQVADLTASALPRSLVPSGVTPKLLSGLSELPGGDHEKRVTGRRLEGRSETSGINTQTSRVTR